MQKLTMTKQELYKELRAKVEGAFGRPMREIRDFANLESQIASTVGERISATTLRRFWGYQEVGLCDIRLHSLDVLCLFAGYTGWDAFCKGVEGGEADIQSGIVVRRRLMSCDLCVGECIRLLWEPNRVIEIRYDGHDRYTVLRRENSKLSVADTFSCTMFVEGESLYLTNLTHDGVPGRDYVCGSDGGIKFLKI